MTSADGLFAMNEFYAQEAGRFVSAISSGSMKTAPLRCPECRAHVSGVQRYGRIVKRRVLDLMLKTLIVRARAKFQSLQDSFQAFETEVEESRAKRLTDIRRIRQPKDRRPFTDHNVDVVKSRSEYFSNMRRQIRQFRAEVDERKQPHVRVYEMSLAARARAEDSHIISRKSSNVPEPDIYFRLWADILGLRLEATFLADQMEFLNRLASCGCERESYERYQPIIDKCHESLKSAEKFQISCQKGANYRLAIEFLLLQLQFVSLERRSAVAISAKPKTEDPSARGFHIIALCDSFLQKYPSCGSYRAAVDGAKRRFTGGGFHQALTAEERKLIALAMQAEFSGTGHWYQCRNGHPVSLCNSRGIN